MMLQQLTPLGASATTTFSQTGRWIASGDLGCIGTHVVLMREPRTNAAKVFLFGESGYSQTMKGWRFFAADTTRRVPSTTFVDSSTGALFTIPHPNALLTDLFCSGHTVLPDGRMLLLGGGWTPPAPCGQVYTFNPNWLPGASDSAWTQSAAMAVERWYATATLLANGRTLATAGTSRSPMIAFGGEVADSSWGTLQPLGVAGRYVWMDTLAVPGDSVYGGRVIRDSYTYGKHPPGREGHALMGVPDGRAVLWGGKRKLGGGAYEYLNDAWLLQGPVNDNDSTHTWRRLETIGDSSLTGIPAPCPRTRFAATWAGVEDTDPLGHLGTSTDPIICFIHGGLDSTGHVLGDLWRGETRPSIHGFPYNFQFGWQWQRLLPDFPSTARYGHTMNFDPGPPTANGAPHGRLLIFGGKKDATTLAANDLFTYGVGRLASQPDSGLWRTLSPTYGAAGVPVAREGHAASPRWLLRSESVERELFMFGGEDVNGTVVAPDLWYLSRHDLGVSDTNKYVWEKVTPPASGGPSGRTRPAMAFSLAGKRMVVVGGDTNGDATAGGLTNDIWNGPVDETSLLSYGQWVRPKMRNFPAHPGPPPIAGMSMFALGNGRDVIAENLEAFDYRVNSPADSCPALPGGWYAASTSNDSLSERPIADYTYMFQLPDGRLFNAGPTPQNPTKPYKRFYNLTTKQWADSTSQAHYDSRDFGSAVMYRPGKILRAGGHGEGSSGFATTSTETISIEAAAIPGWAEYTGVGKPPLAKRTNHNLTLLPTGDVLATGGLGENGLINQAVRRPQIWRVATGEWNNDQVASDTLSPDPKIRNYHSTAILLPDGRVMTAGGEIPNNDRHTASIFEPPYLFDADSYASRPRVLDGPETLPYHRTMTVTLTDSNRVSTIKSVGLVRSGAVTHGFDQNQRYVPLGFVSTGSPKRLLVQSPPDSFVAPPGEYMLFVVDSVSTGARRVPSVARWTIAKNVPGALDSLDVIAPRGGSYVGLSDVSPCNISADLYLGWKAPADDDTLAFSEQATTYNLRYTPNAGYSSNFNAWTAIGTTPPGLVGASEQVIMSGLSSAIFYRFALKSVGDNRDTSSISNTLIAKPRYCIDGGMGGSGGGGGFVTRRAGTSSLRAAITSEQVNSLLPGVPVGTFAQDLLRLSAEPALQGVARSAFVRQGQARGMLLDRARLLAVDHGDTTEAVVATNGAILVGTRRPASTVTDHAGVDRTVEATGVSGSPLYADSGEVVEVVLPAGSGTRALLIESRDGGSRGGGAAVDARDRQGNWNPLGSIAPRRNWDASAMALPACDRVRLTFRGAHELRFAGVLDEVSTASPNSAELLDARSTWSGDALLQVRAAGDSSLAMVAGDTLSLLFSDLAAPQGGVRTWFLGVDGKPVTSSTAKDLARPAQGTGEATVPLAFALRQSVPNPTRGTTIIGFDLPMSARVLLEIFDAQGRRVRRFEGAYAPGRHRVQWDMRSGHGARVPPGIYAYRITAGPQTDQRKLVVLP